MQILKEAAPSASKVAVLDMRKYRESADGQQRREELVEASRLLEISLIDMLVQEATPSEFHVRRDKAALFQWVQAPPGDRSSRKRPEQTWRRRSV